MDALRSHFWKKQLYHLGAILWLSSIIPQCLNP
jgi:hypothetical protein